MNKRFIVFLIGIIWIAIAIAVITTKETVLRTGRVICLETTPVDPRDLLRGDYVVLGYKVGEIDLNSIQSPTEHWAPGATVFVELKQNGAFWRVTAVHKNKERLAGKLFLKGRVSSKARQHLHVTYGIESYFVPEGQGKEIEKQMRGEESAIAVEVVIDQNGTAIIKRLFPITEQ